MLIDVSRLIWRSWRGSPATGVDRVCRAYVRQFHARALAVVQHSNRNWVLNAKYSELLFELFNSGVSDFRSKFLRQSALAFSTARQRPRRDGMLYLNIGHAGLDEPSLPRWIAGNRLRAVYLIHDLIPLLYPEYCRPGEEAKHRLRMENVLKSAHGLIGNSQATIDDLAFFAHARGLPMPPALAAWIAGSQIPA